MSYKTVRHVVIILKEKIKFKIKCMNILIKIININFTKLLHKKFFLIDIPKSFLKRIINPVRKT